MNENICVHLVCIDAIFSDTLLEISHFLQSGALSSKHIISVYKHQKGCKNIDKVMNLPDSTFSYLFNYVAAFYEQSVYKTPQRLQSTVIRFMLQFIGNSCIFLMEKQE